MKNLSKLHILGLFMVSMIVATTVTMNSYAFVNQQNSEHAIGYFTNSDIDLPENLDNPIIFGDFVKLLLLTTGFEASIMGFQETKFNDVPLIFNSYANKLYDLGMIYRDPENPIFGYSSNINISRGIDLGLRLYGLSAPKFLINPTEFQEKVTNFSQSFVLAPQIERALKIGLIDSRGRAVNYFGDLTYLDALNLIYNLRLYAETQLQAPTSEIKLDRPIDHKKSEQYKIFDDVLKRIKEEFYSYDPVAEKDLLYGAISGMVNRLKDPNSVFNEPYEHQAYTNTLNNHIEGIGASLMMNEEGRVMIITPLADSPAMKAGLKPFDIITHINDSSTLNLSLNQAVSKIQGPSGSTVKLTIERNGKSLNFTIIRDTINVPAVTAEITADNIGIITVRNFGNGIEQRFSNFITQMHEAKVKALVLDLRNNPGGYLSSATSLASHFLTSNQTVSKVQYRNQNYEENKSTGTGLMRNVPIYILINGGTASASEILASALKEHVNAKLIGEKTFGKGTVQELITYTDNSSLKLTIANWLTPSGKNINKVGLSPDIPVMNSDLNLQIKNDPVLNRAILEAKKGWL